MRYMLILVGLLTVLSFRSHKQTTEVCSSSGAGNFIAMVSQIKNGKFEGRPLLVTWQLPLLHDTPPTTFTDHSGPCTLGCKPLV